MPASVTSIGDYAFSGCSSLATVTFAEGSQLESVGGYQTFYGCSALQSIEIPANVKSIGDSAFSGCSSLATVTFAEGSQLASIGYSAFSGCSALQSIALPESVTTIKSEAFNGCNALTEITIPKGVTSLPSSLTGTSGNSQRIYYLGTIDDWVKIEFQAGNHSYNSVLSDPDIELYIDNQLVTEVVINSSIINPYALSGYQKLTSVTLTQNVREIGAGAFANCDALTSLYYEGQLNNWLSINFGFGGYGDVPDALSGYNPLANDNVILYINNQPVTEVYISRNVPQKAFSGYKALEKVVIAEGVRSIDDYAFSGCSNLTEFTLPSTINSFGRSPITSDQTLHLYYNGSVETWLNITFASNPLLNEKAILYIDNQPVTELIINSDIPSYAFNGYLALTKVTLGEGVTSIGYGAFQGCYALALVINNSASLTITKSGTDNGYVGYYAKEVVNSGATAQGKIEIIDNVQYYINETTGDFIALAPVNREIESIVITEGTKGIDQRAFYDCSALQSIEISASVTSIGSDAFRNCSSLATVTFAEGSQLKSIGGEAFYGCSSLTEITLPSSLTSIGSNAFRNCSSLATVTFAEGSQLKSIGGEAFYGCSNLTEITLPSSLKSIGYRAFDNCSNLTEIYYQGTMDQWLNMTFEYSWLPSNNNTNLYINNELVDEITINADIPSYAFYGIDSITKVTIGEGVTGIGSWAFSSCSSLATVTFAEGSQLENIGDSAFSGCYALALVINNSTLPIAVDSNYGYVGYYAKEVVNNGATAQGRIEIIDNVQYYINETTGEFIALAPAISGNAINSISIAEGTKEINQYAFNNCNNLTEINLPASVTSIGDYAFNNCSNLATVTIAEGSQLASIGYSAFYGCSSLTEITLPSSVTSIEYSAFYNCTSLATVTIENEYIYRVATGTEDNHAGGLLANAETVRVLTRIVEENDNTYLEDTANFTTSTSVDGKYTVFTKL